jgi:hypothetical protein
MLQQVSTRKKERTARTNPKDHIWEISLDAARDDQPAKDLSVTPTPTPTKAPGADDDEDGDPVDDTGPHDPQLDESLNILSDIVELTAKPASSTLTQK